jgi:hypothetical protein
VERNYCPATKMTGLGCDCFAISFFSDADVGNFHARFAVGDLREKVAVAVLVERHLGDAACHVGLRAGLVMIIIAEWPLTLWIART